MSTIPDAEWKESKARKSDKRVLDDLIQNYEKKQKEKKDKKVVDGHVLDDYISVLSYLHKTQRYKRFFDPIRLRMHLIAPNLNGDDKPQVQGFSTHFLTGCN